MDAKEFAYFTFVNWLLNVQVLSRCDVHVEKTDYHIERVTHCQEHEVASLIDVEWVALRVVSLCHKVGMVSVALAIEALELESYRSHIIDILVRPSVHFRDVFNKFAHHGIPRSRKARVNDVLLRSLL